MGPYITGIMNVHGRTPANKKKVEKLLEPLFEQLHQAGLGTISEIFDGNAPHHPRGCISQAWSVAEVLRSYVEEVLGGPDKSKEDLVPHISKRF